MVTLKLLLISGTVSISNLCIIGTFLIRKLDPREYCISTKDFVVDEDNNLTGLNTGM